MKTDKQWWKFTPAQGWYRCSERDALQVVGEPDVAAVEGCKVLVVDERIDVGAIWRMKRPVMWVHPDVLKEMRERPEIWGPFCEHFPQMEIRPMGFLPTDRITFIDQAAFEPKFIPGTQLLPWTD